MSDPRRPEPLGSFEDSGPDHDAKTEDLLLTGLDHYFAGNYQQAINVWTRVLFLDRGHARARAYIERARSALSEQQRESEEMLHSGVAAFNRGEIELARQLLTSAVDRGGPQELALPILARLNRLEAAITAVESAHRPMAARFAVEGVLTSPSPRSVHRARWIVLAMVVFGAGLLLIRSDYIDWSSLTLTTTVPRGAASATPFDGGLPLPQPAEIALHRARRLFKMGNPTDALRALDVIRPSDALRPDADRLRAEIQRELLQQVRINLGQQPSSPPLVAPPPVESGP
jgi:tetratricopeptide (TPR) repeat protein